jgi:hypothetical protein
MHISRIDTRALEPFSLDGRRVLIETAAEVAPGGPLF